jgi:fructose-1,6-bisphosphatase/inositol monophosphatase family enzyme
VNIPARSAARIRQLLCGLQDHILAHLQRARAEGAGGFARVAAVTASDTIYQVDRISEAAVDAWLEQHWPKTWPIEVVMEGRDPGSTFPRGLHPRQTLFKLILDPIDGTRNLMYDKRSAWTLAGVAPQRGAGTHLGDIAVAAMTELPTSKQDRSDQFSAVRGRGLVAETIDLRPGGQRTRFQPRPSRARHCRGGFASVVRFFPEASALLGSFEEELWRRLYADCRPNSALVFEDQYLSTGGQIYELLVGHDRLIADLRPLAYRKLALAESLTCHPYDIATALLLQEAGGLVEDPGGRPLRVRLDAVSAVAWVGYANPALARHVRPVLRRLVREMF